MPDNHAKQPPVETKLPDDLAQCESMLRGMSVPESRVQRDELIYQAGWAAAEVHAKSVAGRDTDAKQPSGRTGRRLTLAWSLAIAAIAASLAVAITVRLRPMSESPAVAPADAVVGLSRPEDTAIGPEREQSSETLANLAPQTLNRGTGVSWTASLLIMRDRALFQQWDDRWMVSDHSLHESLADDGILSQPKTSREMLQEFLPGRSAPETSNRDSTRRGLHWPWNTDRLGDTT